MSEEPVVKPLGKSKREIIKRCHKLSWEIYKRESRKKTVSPRQKRGVEDKTNTVVTRN